MRHLLTHTSGIAYRDGVDPLLQPAPGADSLAQRVAKYRNLNLAHPIGTYDYSSANYVILGRLVESVTGIAFEEYVQAHIFTPLGMRNSFLAVDEARQNGMAQGYFPWFGIPVPTDPPYLRFQVPEHNMIASAEDIARFLGVFLNQGRFEGATLLRPETVAASLQVQSQPPGEGHDGYGFGWYVRPGETNKRYHPGWNKHFHADAWLAMDAGLGVVVMANLNNNMGLQHALVEVSHNAYQIMQGNPHQEVGPAFRRQQWMLNGVLLILLTALVAWADGAPPVAPGSGRGPPAVPTEGLPPGGGGAGALPGPRAGPAQAGQPVVAEPAHLPAGPGLVHSGSGGHAGGNSDLTPGARLAAACIRWTTAKPGCETSQPGL